MNKFEKLKLAYRKIQREFEVLFRKERKLKKENMRLCREIKLLKIRARKEEG
jgi:hypothetical protein